MFSTYDLLDLFNSQLAPHARSFDLLSTRVVPRLLNGFAFPPALLPSLLATYRVSTSHLALRTSDHAPRTTLHASIPGSSRATLEIGHWTSDFGPWTAGHGNSR